MSSESNKPSKVQVFRSSRWNRDHARTAPKKQASTKKRRPDSDPKLPCQIKDICRTCSYINGDYRESLLEKHHAGLKQLDDAKLTDVCIETTPFASPRTLHYRTHAKLAVRPGDQAIKPLGKTPKRFALGLFQPESHQLVEIGDCPLHRQTINAFVRDLAEALEESQLEPYNEQQHQGDLRYISIRASHLTDELMITYVITSDACRLALKNISMKLRQKGHQISSAHVNINSDATNAIFGTQSKRILGSDRLREELCGLGMEIGPSSFFQVNPWQAGQIYRRIEQMIGEDSNPGVAWDLYCGIGIISMLLARAGYLTLGIEENPQAVRDAQRNVVRNDLPQQPNFMSGRVEDLFDQLPSWASDPKVIVVNPSRRGLNANVSQGLAKILDQLPDTRLIYMSCEIKTLVRDLQIITAGRKKLRQIEGYDMFPFTEKMEWLAVVQ